MEKKERVTCCSVILEGGSRCEKKGQFKKNGTEVFVKGYCQTHYSRYKNKKELLFTKYNRDGRKSHPHYTTYMHIIYRCTNKLYDSYNRYGKRGIKVYDKWLEAINGVWYFYEYIESLEYYGKEGYSLDRRNNNGNYEPNNLRWANRHTQCSNKGNNNINVGVSYYKQNSTWRATLHVNNKRYQEYYKKEEDAIIARKNMEQKYLNKNA
jgi:hypothetical protein